MTVSDDLLMIQELDTTLDQLRHRRATLSELAMLSDLRAAFAGAEVQRNEVAARLHTLRSAQKEAEDHASLLEDKAREVNTSMYDGSVTAHKELEALTEEHRSLGRRQGEFEDRALELMEEAEPVESEQSTQDAAMTELRTRIESVDAQLVVARTELDVEIERVEAERGQADVAVPDQLMATYEDLRSGLGGVAVARLNGARCEGCHLEIPSAELEGVRRAPEDSMVSCPECLRILVR